MYGTGIYFANNSHYSRNYEHTTTITHGGQQQKAYQMFFCSVLVGESVSLAPQKLQVPPLKRDHAQSLQFTCSGVANDSERFDSVRNQTGSHYIIYDFNKQYPGYLITYL